MFWDAHKSEVFYKGGVSCSGVAEELLASGVIDPESCAAELLESAGYLLTTDESGYITRNSREFIHDRTAPERAEPVMGPL